MSRFGILAFSGAIALFLQVQPAAGQAVVEAGLGAAGSATGAAGARPVGRGISGAFRNLDKTLKSTGRADTSTPTTTPTTKPKVSELESPAPVQPAPPTYEDAAGIRKGMDRDELLRRFGPPVMQFAGTGGARTMTYLGKGASVQVECQGEKVTSVEITRTRV